MINLVINTNEIFWEANPDAKIIFSKTYSEDESEQKKESSRIMWAYTLLYHPYSILSEFAYSEKLKFITESYLYEDWNPEDNPELNKKFKDFALTRKQRILVNWEKQIDEREQFMNSITYQENYEVKEKIMGNNKKVWDEFSRAEAEVMKEKEQSNFGGAEESAEEKGLI